LYDLRDLSIFRLERRRLMVTRAKIVEEIEKVPDEYLEELYRMIKGLEVNGTDAEFAEGVMARLRKIKISASPDLSIKANLYELEGEDAK
jgi:hypothetical protein